MTARQPGQGVRERRVLLAAARRMFTEHGYAGASVACALRLAGSDGCADWPYVTDKEDLFVALWRYHQEAHAAAAAGAVAEARRAGITDSVALFDAGTRAFLLGSYRRRDLALLFASGDAPRGFEALRRSQNQEWVGQNRSLLGLPDDSVGRLRAATLAAIVGGGGYEVAAATSRRQAADIIDAVAGYARVLTTTPV